MPTFVAPVTVGTVAAATGSVRLMHGQKVVWRNGANTADEAMLEFNSGISYYDNLTPSGYHEFRQGAGYTMMMRIGSTNVTVGTSLVVNGSNVSIGTNSAGSGVIRLPNGLSNAITWRNAANSNDIQALYVTSSDDLWCNTGSGKNLYMAHGGAAIAQFNSLGLQMNPGFNIVTYGNGFKVGGSNAEKIAFWGATPVVQPANTAAIDDLLVTTGLRASGGIANFTSAIAYGTNYASAGQIRLPNNTGAYWRNAANTGDWGSIQFSTANRLQYEANAGHQWYISGVAAMAHTAGGLDVSNYVSATGLTGATAASRYVGATTSGAPVSGTFAKGDLVVDQTGKIWINTTAGSPGTFTQVGGSTAAEPYWQDAKWGVD